MNAFLLLLVGLAAVFVLLYLLYSNGIGVINSKAALVYQGYPRIGKNQNRIKADFVSCHGTTKRVLCLQPGKMYHFAFSSVIARGTVCVEIGDKKNDDLVVLDQQHPSAILSVGSGGKLYVTTRFTRADGKYELSWDLQE